MPFGWGDYDVVPDEFEHWEPEPECRAKSGECDLNGRCYRCNAIEGEHCREANAENQSLDLEGDYGRAANESSLDDVRELLEGRP